MTSDTDKNPELKHFECDNLHEALLAFQDGEISIGRVKEYIKQYTRADTAYPVTKEAAMKMLEKLNRFAAINGISDQAGKQIAWDFIGYNESQLRALLEAAAK